MGIRDISFKVVVEATKIRALVSNEKQNEEENNSFSFKECFMFFEISLLCDVNVL
jgi:hypothetical protein